MKFSIDVELSDALINQLKEYANKKNVSWQSLLRLYLPDGIFLNLSEDLDNYVIESVLPKLEAEVCDF